MKVEAPRRPFQFLERGAEIFQVAAVGVFEVTGRCPESDESRKAVDHRTKATLVRTQSFLGPLSVVDIGIHSAPFDDPSGCIDQGRSTEEEPAILPVEAPQAHFHFIRLAGSQNGSPAFEQPRQVFGVGRSLPRSVAGFVDAKGFLNAKPSIFAPASIEKIDVPIKPLSPYQSGKCIDDVAEPDLHSGPFKTYARRDARLRHAMGQRPSYLGVGLRRDGSNFERIAARSMTFCSSRMLPGHSYC